MLTLLHKGQKGLLHLNKIILSYLILYRFNYLFELITKIRFSNNTFEFIN